MTITRFTHAWTILLNARSTTCLLPFALLPTTTLIEDQNVLKSLGTNEQGQDIAKYGVMLALILVLVMGTLRLVGSNVNNVFSSVASSVR
jgi:pilus assembly protein Flp/PilA